MDIRVYDHRETASRFLLIEALESHPELVQCPHLVREAVRALHGTLSVDDLAIFIAVTHMGFHVGKYARVHNRLVDDYVLGSKWDTLCKHAQQGQKVYVEAFDNPSLTTAEVTAVVRALDEERSIISSILDNYRGDHPLPGRSILPKAGCSKTTMYDKCRDMMCTPNGILPCSPYHSGYVWLVDKAQGRCVPTIYYYNIEDLITDISTQGICSNRHSGCSFDSSVLALLRDRFSKEIKMYNRSVQDL